MAEQKNLTFAANAVKMTQILVNIENPEIVPNLRKVLGQFNGVTIESIESVDDEKTVLNSIEKGYREAMEAESNGKKLPDLDSLIEELQSL